ncbi:membrane protein [Clostridiales bacterium PH28_bin88]|nr:membrane protein [Clostridiales bacterium PH28_bin88]
MLGGLTLLPPDWVPWLDRTATWALWLMIHAVGIDLGGNSASWKQVRRIGWNVLLVPLMIAVGSVVGAVITGFAAGLPVNEASAVGAGFGWYSLSGVLLTQVYHVQTGTLAFLTNVTREVMSFMIIPLLYRQGKTITCIAPGGATTMDTTLPVVTRVAGTEMAPLAFISGSTLTFLVPVLVPLLIKLPF